MKIYPMKILLIRYLQLQLCVYRELSLNKDMMLCLWLLTYLHAAQLWLWGGHQDNQGQECLWGYQKLTGQHRWQHEWCVHWTHQQIQWSLRREESRVSFRIFRKGGKMDYWNFGWRIYAGGSIFTRRARHFEGGGGGGPERNHGMSQLWLDISYHSIQSYVREILKFIDGCYRHKKTKLVLHVVPLVWRRFISKLLITPSTVFCNRTIMRLKSAMSTMLIRYSALVISLHEI